MTLLKKKEMIFYSQYARLCLETQSECYFDSPKFLQGNKHIRALVP